MNNLRTLDLLRRPALQVLSDVSSSVLGSVCQTYLQKSPVSLPGFPNLFLQGTWSRRMVLNMRKSEELPSGSCLDTRASLFFWIRALAPCSHQVNNPNVKSVPTLRG